jgi:hypothetical protein
MLVSKEQEPHEVLTVSAVATPVVTLPLVARVEASSDVLLAELVDLVAAQKLARQVSMSFYVGGGVLCATAIFSIMVWFMSNPISSHMALFLTLIFAPIGIMLAGLYGGIWHGRRYYKRNRDRLTSIVSELAARGDSRMLPHLLGVMDIRNSGVLMWKECRPVFMEALETVLGRVTPEEFQELPDSQMWEIASLMLYPDGRLSQVVEATAVRCGDSHMLAALQKLRKLCLVSHVNPKSPLTRISPNMRWLIKEGVPFATPGTIQAIERTIAFVTVNVDEANRNAQLLRASAPSAEQVSRELLRAASPIGKTASDELVRAAGEEGLPVTL